MAAGTVASTMAANAVTIKASRRRRRPSSTASSYQTKPFLHKEERINTGGRLAGRVRSEAGCRSGIDDEILRREDDLPASAAVVEQARGAVGRRVCIPVRRAEDDPWIARVRGEVAGV